MSAAVSIRNNAAPGRGQEAISAHALYTILAYQTFMNNEETLNDSFETDSSLQSKLQDYLKQLLTQAVPTIFGVFINLLDACTFGSVFFPSYMGNNSQLVVELFLLSTVFSQIMLMYFSSFQSALGTSMAENIPFIHSICDGIYHDLQTDPLLHQKILPTALVAISLSVIINGLLFLGLGYFQMGNILHFFPRYVLLGLNAGFGIFLIGTAFEIATGLPMVLSSIPQLSTDMIIQLMTACALEIILRGLAYYGINEIIISVVMFLIPLMFYIITFFAQVSLSDARNHLWLFPETSTTIRFHWYNTWDSYFHWEYIDWDAIVLQFPTIGLLAVFTMILVPVRIPSLALITNEEVIFDEELIAQGLGNVISGLFGCPHNYLSYSNSIFYYILHGKGNTSRWCLTAITFAAFFFGSSLMNYVPRLIASLIMIHLGTDLLISSLYENSQTLNRIEFFCLFFVCWIVAIFGFVIGMSLGILLACVTFVIASSNEQNIRSIFIGNEARSDTQWSAVQETKLQQAIKQGSAQIYVIELQGHLFFGNVQRVIHELQTIIEPRPTPEAETEFYSHERKRKYSIHGVPPLASTTKSHSMDLPPYLAGKVHQSHHGNHSHKEVNDENHDENVTKLINVVLDCTFLAGADVNAINALYKFKEKYERSKGNAGSELDRDNSTASKHSSFRKSLGRSSSMMNPFLSRSPQYQIVFAGLLPALQEIFEIIDTREKERKRKAEVAELERQQKLAQKEAEDIDSLQSNRDSPASTNAERQSLLPKISSVSNLLKRAASRSFYQYQLNVLQLSTIFYHDVNTALHAIEEELVRVIPDTSTIEDNEHFFELMSTEYQGFMHGRERDNSEGEDELIDEFESEDYLKVYSSDQKEVVTPTRSHIPSPPLLTEFSPHLLPSSSPPSLTIDLDVVNDQQGHQLRREISFESPTIRTTKSRHRKKKKLLEYFQYLGSNLWEEYDEIHLESLAQQLSIFPVSTFQPQEIIWKKGSESNELGLLMEGKICSLLDNGVSFQSVLPPALIGLSCIVKEKTRTRTLVAVEEGTKIMLIPHSFLRRLEEKNRPVYSVLVTMALRGLYFRQRSEYSLFHAGSITTHHLSSR